ncbi:MAG: hypothetical protein ABIJ57_09425 [Pseudomonadota bacterium]|uniref:Uncharacterized protein n=1 Tax=viral metagenome TaxID=1070528 RepID=A0A6M3J6C6_9ZZZZ
MSITTNSHSFSVFGDKAAVVADLAFSGDYTYGGVSLNPDQLLGIHDVELALLEAQGGYSFVHDKANKKVKLFAPAPPIVYEEKQTPSSDIVTTKYPAAFFMNAARSGNNKKFRSTGVALASLGDDEISLVSQMVAGERTQIRVKDYDRLAGDGAFTGGTTNWTFNAAPWTYGTNALNKDADGTNALTHDTFAAVVGRTYRLAFTLSSWTVGAITPTLGGTAGTAFGEDGTSTQEITATTTDGISFAPTSTSRFTIDSITIYDITEPVYITYITQAWKDIWDNLVQDETKTLATGANTLTSGNKILACMYIDQTTATAAALTMIDSDDTAASGEIDLLFNSATAQFTAHADQNAKAVKTTYIKVPDSGFLADRIFTNETATKVGSDPYLNTFANTILLWGYTGQLPVNGGTTQRMIDFASTPGAGEFTIDFFNGSNRGTPATPTGAGASHDHAFTGTSAGSLDLATPAFSGTGLTAAGQVMTTTDNQTMALNQCAGMWLIPVTQATPPMLILSNTAVTGAPAVLTVQGAAATNAGTYKVVKNIVPVGSNAAEATHTHAITATSSYGTIMDVKSNVTGTGAGVRGAVDEIVTIPLEVVNGDDLSALTSVKALFIGV